MDATASAGGGTVGAGKAGVVAASVSWGLGVFCPLVVQKRPVVTDITENRNTTVLVGLAWVFRVLRKCRKMMRKCR